MIYRLQQKRSWIHFIWGWNLISNFSTNFSKLLIIVILYVPIWCCISKLSDRLKNNWPIYQIHEIPCLQKGFHNLPTILSQSSHDPPTTLLRSYNNGLYKKPFTILPRSSDDVPTILQWSSNNPTRRRFFYYDITIVISK